MPDLLIRGLDEQTMQRLKAHARRHGRSLQGEAKAAIEAAAGLSVAEALKLGRDWRKRLGPVAGDAAEDIRSDRAR